MWDRTYDEQFAAFTGNVWRRFTAIKEQWTLWFTAFRPQEFYKVAVYYYHYAEGGIPAHRIYTYVDEYVGDQAASDGKSCWFRQ